MNGRIEQPGTSHDMRESKSHDVALRNVLVLIVVVIAGMMLLPSLLNAQDPVDPGPGNDINEIEAIDESGYEPEDAVQPSGWEDEQGIEPFQESPGIGDGDLFVLPEIGMIDEITGEEIEISAGVEERTIFNARPYDPFYELVVREAPIPDITRLGPLPEILEEGVEFTDVAGDWIYYQKSVGLTEIRGHSMVIYDTTIISSDEAILDEKTEIYHFFGEGRVFVDDADFTLECDELEIHDAEEEKMIYIFGPSTLLVYADEDAEEPGEDSTRRERFEYAFKQHDTIITFTDAEYDYENDIFDAHNGVRFEQPDKTAEGDEFHGENETEYMLFTGNCEFWQADGFWMYEHRIVEDEEDPPSRGDRIKRALLSVPTTITCDEAEAEFSNGWLQLRSVDSDVVYFHQEDKHAECDYFTLLFTDPDEEEEEEEVTEPEVPRNLLEEDEPVIEEEVEEERIWIKPPGYGSLRYASEFSPNYVPWETYTLETETDGPEVIREFEEEIRESGLAGERSGESGPTDFGIPGISEEDIEGIEEFISDYTGDEQIDIEDLLEMGGIDFEDGTVPGIHDPFDINVPVIPGEEPDTDSDPDEVEEEHDSLEALTQVADSELELATEGIPEEYEGGRDEIFMHGNVFIRQENGDWLFEYDVVNEEDETEEDIEQYRKWANGSCDMLHVWTVDENAEAIGSVFGEQDNQDLTTDFMRYMSILDMVYLNGNVAVNREGKHSLLSNEAFMFLTTNVFEAMGSVQTRVMVDVEEEREKREAEEEETPE